MKIWNQGCLWNDYTQQLITGKRLFLCPKFCLTGCCCHVLPCYVSTYYSTMYLHTIVLYIVLLFSTWCTGSCQSLELWLTVYSISWYSQTMQHAFTNREWQIQHSIVWAGYIHTSDCFNSRSFMDIDLLYILRDVHTRGWFITGMYTSVSSPQAYTFHYILCTVYVILLPINIIGLPAQPTYIHIESYTKSPIKT